MDQPWLALAIGNSRLHWALEMPDQPRYVWHTPHLSEEAIAALVQSGWNFAAVTDRLDGLRLGRDLDRWISGLKAWHQNQLPLWGASVVPEQTRRWQSCDRPMRQFVLADVPIQGMYPTLGIDRAIALWGLLQRSQTDSLVIDAGTALTFSATTAQGQFVGGAIAPGLSLQLRSLGRNTAALPMLSARALAELPSRWAMTTEQSIVSGILHTMLAGIVAAASDWNRLFPNGAIALTGGDGSYLHGWLRQAYPAFAFDIQWQPDLLMDGMRSLTAKISGLG